LCLVAGVGYNRDEGFRRACQFNVSVLPICLHYKALELLSTRGWLPSSMTFEDLHKRYAPRSLEIILQQKGFYVKTAQFLSQYPDVLPKEYVEAYKILRDDAPSMPFEVVKAIIESDLQLPLGEVFLDFDPTPLGAASIGQAHAATLVDGTEVVVKVQYPEAEKQFNIDIDLCINAAWAIAPYYEDILKQLRKTFANEFDYQREAKLQRQAHENLRLMKEVVVPVPYDDEHPTALRLFGRGLASKNVFVMERLWGQPVDRWAQEQINAMAARQGVTPEEAFAKLRSLGTAEVQRLVPSRSTLRAYRALLGVSDALRNSAAFSFNWTLGLLTGRSMAYQHSSLPINVHQVVDRLFEVQAKSIFEDGFFNGDPHAGNVLLLEDGRLGLIDWGQVDCLTYEQRLLFAKAVIAVADRDEPLIAKMAGELGMRTKFGNEWVRMKLGTYYLGSFGDDVVAELGGATSFELNLARIDPLESTAQTYFSAIRCLMMTRGVAALMGFPGVDSAAKLKPHAEAWLRKAGQDTFVTSPGRKLERPDLQKLLGLPPR